MKLEPRMENRTAQPFVAIPIQVTLQEWGQANALLGEVIGWMVERGMQPSGPPVYRYRIIGDSETKFDLEVGWLVSAPAEGDGRVIAGEIPAGTYVAATHVGHPDRLFDVSAHTEAWASESGIDLATSQDGDHEVWDGRFQLFMTDPAVEPDPEKWVVEVLYLTRDNEGQRA